MRKKVERDANRCRLAIFTNRLTESPKKSANFWSRSRSVIGGLNAERCIRCKRFRLDASATAPRAPLL
jgi:hypothetical protein